MFMGIKLGDVRPLGLSRKDKNLNVCFISSRDDCGLVVYDLKTKVETERISFPVNCKRGNLFAVEIEGLGNKKFAYQFYEEDKLIKDPYAKAYIGNETYGQTGDVLAVYQTASFDWEEDLNPRIPYEDSFVYLLHVRGFTKHVSSKVKAKGTFKGIVEKIDYLKDLGVTTLELQPAYEFDETVGKYWGYCPGNYYVPKNSYSHSGDGVKEFKQMVKTLHSKGMELVMQFYFPENITEWDALEILSHWICEYHVDGFHIKAGHLNVERLKDAPILADCKLWYTHFEQKPLNIYEQKQDIVRRVAVYNKDYCYQMRGLLKGDEGLMDACAKWMRANRAYEGQINFLTNYDMFTLNDLVSYERKHNEANGEDNQDGADFNCSWNCGVEGATKKKTVLSLRTKQMENAMCLLMLSQGTPLIMMGDEFGDSRDGNNNPYCQDNEIGWLNWSYLEKNKSFYLFVKSLILLRKEHPILHKKESLRLMDYISCGYPDLSYHGEEPWKPCFEYHSRQLGVMLCGKYAKIDRKTEDDFFYLAFNLQWDDHVFGLPGLPKELQWDLEMSTDDNVALTTEEKSIFATVPARSIAIFKSSKKN